MFSGLVKGVGRVASRTNSGSDARFVVELGSAGIAPLAVGGSIAVNGVCLTAVAVTPNGFTADVSAATLAVTTLGRLAAGARVNLEPPLRAGDPLDGHIVTGHVDGRLKLKSRERVGEALKLGFEILDGELARYVAPKGSVAVDGVSLTVNSTSGREFEVVIIPHTMTVTNLGHLMPTDEANLEVDILARYVAQLLPNREGRPSEDEALLTKLRDSGFI